MAPEWPIDQIARMDRIVLRIGLYELENEADVPPKVVINEAVELAKAFGGDNSSKFVNGVLGTLLRQREGRRKAAKPPRKPAAKKSRRPPKRNPNQEKRKISLCNGPNPIQGIQKTVAQTPAGD